MGNQKTRGADKFNDQIVLTRKLNHSELIFNQKISNDQIKSNRFFKKDAYSDWQLSMNNQCYVCELYQYTCVFYDRKDPEKNKGLNEIHDQELLDQLAKEYNQNIKLYKTQAPLICGTVVNKGQE